MTNPDKTVIALLVDRSGSMASIRTDAEGAINTFLEEQRKLPGECLVQIAQFDDIYELQTPLSDINDVKPFILQPRGITALLDAIGRTVNILGNKLKALPENDRPGTVMVVIVTDGYENASLEYNSEQIKELVTHQTDKYNWKFVFLAANQDAVLTGASYGFGAGSSLTFGANSDGVKASGIALASYATTTRSGGSYTFTDEDRKASAGS